MRTTCGVLFVMAALLTVAPAEAQQVRETAARCVVDVPDDWSVRTKTTNFTITVADPPERNVHLILSSTNHGMTEHQLDQARMMQFLQNVYSDVKVTVPAKSLDSWPDFNGIEVGGTAKDGSTPLKFQMFLLMEKKNPKNGVVAIIAGDQDGFAKHQPGLYRALRAMHTY
jgi:hypothetical protein